MSLRIVTAAYAASGQRQNLIIDQEQSPDVFKGIALWSGRTDVDLRAGALGNIEGVH